MRLPPDLDAGVERVLERWPIDDLRRGVGALEHRYRGGADPPRPSDRERAAYLAVRLPATFAVAGAVLTELARRTPGLTVESLLDLGAGPAPVLWAAADTFPSLRHATVVERDAATLGLARRLWPAASPIAVDWREDDLDRFRAPRTYDLVVASYAFGELPESQAARAVQRAWQSCSGALVIVEPGSPAGFATVLRARQALVVAGASIAAPCPHDRACPVQSPDWCHFAVRLGRSARHRRLKGGTLAYEDEKYSYVAAARAAHPAPARIIARPAYRPGVVELRVCGPRGLERDVVSRRRRGDYRAARDAAWGGAWITRVDAGSSR